MRQLATAELTNVSGGSDELLFLGLGLATIGLMASYPSYSYPVSYYPTYSTYPSYYYTPVCDQLITPVFDPYSGAYMGDMVDTYCW